MYHGEKGARKAEKEFERVFQKKKTPSKVKSVKLKVKSWNIVDLLMKSKLVQSRSEAKRLIEQGGVEIDKYQIPNTKYQILIKDGMILRVGKRRFAKLVTSH